MPESFVRAENKNQQNTEIKNGSSLNMDKFEKIGYNGNTYAKMGNGVKIWDTRNPCSKVWPW